MKKAAKEAAGNWRKFCDFSWHGRPNHADEYTLVYTVNRDSGLMDQSNDVFIHNALMPWMDTDVIPQHHNHWAVGWVDGYAIRVFRGGQITDAFRKYHELTERLKNYPILDEDDYNERIREATFDNLRVSGVFADQAREVYDWLCDNKPDAVEDSDDRGGCPSNKDIQEALDALSNKAAV
jgi:hypothetical protein